MKKVRNAAITTAIAGVLVAPLAIGTKAALADELSDLRANQELLQRRLDQLAQTTGNPNLPGAGANVGPTRQFSGEPGPGNVGMTGGSFPRSFLIPGTDTSLRVGGEIRENFLYWFTGGNPNGTPQSTNAGATGQVESIPLDIHTAAGNPAKSRGNAVFVQQPAQSKVNFETRTPTAWGEARTFMEFDWAGSNAFVPGGARGAQGTSDSLIPRLRFAYGTLGGVLAGQANSNFSDPDANGETIDFGGNLGEPGFTRIPQIRYTQPLAPWGIPGALSVSAEAPETDMWLAGPGIVGSDAGAVAGLAATTTTTNPYTGVALTESPVLTAPFINPTKATLPDLTAAWYIPQPWGHMDFSAVLRPGLQLKDGLFVDRTFVGYGGHFGGDVKPGWFGWAKDDIIFHFVYGDGIGRFLNSSTNFAVVSNYSNVAPPTQAAAANIRALTTVEWGGEVGYQHWWADNWRSNINAGVNHHDIPTNLRTVSAGGTIGASAVCQGGTAAAFGATGGCGLNKEMWTAHANLIWNPVPFVDVVVEYMWGHRQTVSNVKGDENVLLSKFGVKF